MISEVVDNKVYLATTTSVSVYQFNNKGDVSFVQEKKFPFEIRIFCRTGKRFAITSVNGTTYLLDENTLEPTEIISVIDGVPVRNVLEDKDENIWLSTLDKGLYKVQKKRISAIDNAVFKQNLTAILKDKVIVAGNNSGELFSYDGLYTKRLLLANDKTIDGWVRKIIKTNYGLYIATQSASFLVDEKTFAIKRVFSGKAGRNQSSKAALLLNDTTMILGGHAFAFLYNLKTNKLIDSIAKRVVSLGVDKEKNIYIGSNEGLEKLFGTMVLI
jgi:ligand-binding sensor domain-containing protein